MNELRVAIDGMSCEGCVRNLTQVLGALPGVSGVTVSLAEAAACIVFDPALTGGEAFVTAIEDAGFAACLPAA